MVNPRLHAWYVSWLISCYVIVGVMFPVSFFSILNKPFSVMQLLLTFTPQKHLDPVPYFLAQKVCLFQSCFSCLFQTAFPVYFSLVSLFISVLLSLFISVLLSLFTSVLLFLFNSVFLFLSVQVLFFSFLFSVCFCF